MLDIYLKQVNSDHSTEEECDENNDNCRTTMSQSKSSCVVHLYTSKQNCLKTNATGTNKSTAGIELRSENSNEIGKTLIEPATHRQNIDQKSPAKTKENEKDDVDRDSFSIPQVKPDVSQMRLLVIDGVRDFRRLTKIFMKNQDDFVEKYLTNSNSSNFGANVKYEFLRSLTTAKECLVALENCFLQGLIALDKINPKFDSDGLENEELANDKKGVFCPHECYELDALDSGTSCCTCQLDESSVLGLSRSLSELVKEKPLAPENGARVSSVSKNSAGGVVIEERTYSCRISDAEELFAGPHEEHVGENLMTVVTRSNSQMSKENKLDPHSSGIPKLCNCTRSNESVVLKEGEATTKRYMNNPIEAMQHDTDLENALLRNVAEVDRSLIGEDESQCKAERIPFLQLKCADALVARNSSIEESSSVTSQADEIENDTPQCKMDIDENGNTENLKEANILTEEDPEIIKNTRNEIGNGMLVVEERESAFEPSHLGKRSLEILPDDGIDKIKICRPIQCVIDIRSSDSEDNLEPASNNRTNNSRGKNCQETLEIGRPVSINFTNSKSDELKNVDGRESTTVIEKDVKSKSKLGRPVLVMISSDSDDSGDTPLNKSIEVTERESKFCTNEREENKLIGRPISQTNSSDSDQNEESESKKSIDPVDEESKFVENKEQDARIAFLESGSSASDVEEDSNNESRKKCHSYAVTSKFFDKFRRRNVLDLNSDDDEDKCEKDVQRLTNLKNLFRCRSSTSRISYSSDDEEYEKKPLISENENHSKEFVSNYHKRKRKELSSYSKKSLEAYVTDSEDDLPSLTYKNDLKMVRVCDFKMIRNEQAKRLLLLASKDTDDDSSGSEMSSASFSANNLENSSRNVAPKKIGVREWPRSFENDNVGTYSHDIAKKKKRKRRRKNYSLRREELLKINITEEEGTFRRDRNIKYHQKKVELSESDSSPNRSDESHYFSSMRKSKRSISSPISNSSSDCSDTKPNKTKKRRRIHVVSEDDRSENEESSQPPPPYSVQSKSCKNIDEVMSEEVLLSERTLEAGREEEARRKRIAERQAAFDDITKRRNLPNSKLVLDYDFETLKELITVDTKLVEKLKPHQAAGVKFMFDAVFESVQQAAEGNGSGCILAHCMGLGKTLQVITLVHTLLSQKEVEIKTVLIICPVTTAFNWSMEFDRWLKDVENKDNIKVYDLTKNYRNSSVKTARRSDLLKRWTTKGGVMITSYGVFRSLVDLKSRYPDTKLVYLQLINSALINPGPDLVVCDEGHVLKSEASRIWKAVMRIKTRRRIVLTGTPLQNNLNEYHSMMQFVKPDLLGNKIEFQNWFANPITNGQFSDSTAEDVKLMKEQSYVLHRKLDGIVQRVDYNVLKPFLEPKHEFVIFVRLSDLQAELYTYFVENKTSFIDYGRAACMIPAYQSLRLLWNHPLTMKFKSDREAKIQEKEKKSDDDSERDEENDLSESDDLWWRKFVSGIDLKKPEYGPKLLLLFDIVRLCEQTGEKLLVFSSSIPTLDVIEYFLNKKAEFLDRPNDYSSRWEKNLDYLRIDGTTPKELRMKYSQTFNHPDNTRVRLLLVSTLTGGLGINLTSANRVVIFDVNWNPSVDIQSIFRIHRLGQTKPCYIYRFVSQGTMEDKMYKRQINKLSLSCRVVDELQIKRHYSQHNVRELYTLEQKPPTARTFVLPKDSIMAELLKKHTGIIIDYHEHDSLLENVQEEEMTEEERILVWQKYNEKNLSEQFPARQ